MNDDVQQTYNYNGVELSTKDLLKSMDNSWYSYAKFMGWSPDKANAAYDAYQQYRQAIIENRLSSGADHKILDSAGVLSTGDLTYYTSSGRPLSVTQKDKENHTKTSVVLNDIENSDERTSAYRNAKKKDTKYSNSFDANFEAASFVDIVAGKLAEKYQEIWDKELADKKAADEKAAKEAEAAKKKADAGKEKKDKEAEERANTPVVFDPAIHGFWAQFKNGVTGGSGTFDWDTILDLDPYNEESKSRPTAARAVKLANYIDPYISWLGKTKNWDFSKMGASYPDVNSYIEALRALYNDLTTEERDSNGVMQRVGALIDSSDLSRLAALGATPTEYKQYFTTEKTYTPTTSTGTTDSNTSSQDVSDELVNDWYTYYENENPVEELTEKIHKIPDNGKKDIRFIKTKNGVEVLISEDEFPTELHAKIEKLNKDSGRTPINPDLNFDENSTGEGWPEFIRGYYEVYRQQHPIMFRTLNYNGLYDGWVSMPGTYNSRNFTVLIFNPSTGEIGRVFVGFLSQDWINTALADLKEKLRNTSPANRVLPQSTVVSHGSGGTLVRKLQTGGDPAPGLDAIINAAKTEQQKVSTSVQQSLNDYANSPSSHRLSDGFTATDYVRLAGAAADLFAVLYPGATGSFVAGLGSTFLNLGADIADKQSAGKVFTNFGVNLGLSTVGALPIVGQVLGSGTKLAKFLVQITPKLVGALAGVGMIGQIPNIINSFKKIGTGEATTDDLRNILLGIQVVLGGATALRRAIGIHAVRVRGANLSNGSVEVPVKVKNADGTFTHKYMTVPESEAGAIRAAKESKNVESLQNEVKRLSDGQYVLDTSGQHEEMGRPDFNLLKPSTWKKQMTGYDYDFDFDSILETNPEAVANSYKDLSSLSVRKQVANRFEKQSPKVDRENLLTIHPGSPATKMSEQELLDSAAKFYTDNKSAITSPDRTVEHSDFFKELLRRNDNYSTKELVELGLYGAGGQLSRARRVLKASGGSVVPKFQDSGKIWGTTGGYSNTDFEKWLTQYDLSKGVPSSSAMGEAHKNNIGHAKNTVLGPYIVPGETWKPEDLNYGANIAWTKVYGGDDNGAAVRAKDMANWMNIVYDPNKIKSAEDLLQLYNNDYYAPVAGLRWNHPEGGEWYRTGDDVANFNKLYNAMYGTANELISYDPNQISTYGSSSSVRPVDITKDAVKVDVAGALKGTANADALLKLIEGYTFYKAPNGAYYMVKNEEPPASGADDKGDNNAESGGGSNNGSQSGVRGDVVHESPGGGTTGTKFFNIIPETIDLTRFGLGFGANDKMNVLAKQSPVNLGFPNTMNKWVEGNQTAIQNGYAADAELMHRLNTAISPDPATQIASLLEGHRYGQSEISQGYQLNDANVDKTREANWTQMLSNKKSQYDSAITNLDRLTDKRISDLSADMGKIRSNYESWNNFLNGIQTKTEEFRNEALDYNKAVLKNNIKNDIYANPRNYGIGLTDEELELLTAYKKGLKRREKMTDEELATIDRLESAIEEATAIQFGKRYYGIVANVFRPRTKTSAKEQTSVSADNITQNPDIPPAEKRNGGVLELIDSFAKGGKTGGDSVTIQKMRGKIQKMQTFQRHLEARMNALEKDMDRMQRGSVYYSRGQRGK